MRADEDPSVQREWISFGPFRLVVSERRLEKSGVPISLGGRAFDILNLLTERAGDVVSKKEIFDRVWPKITVDEVSLRVHIAALRRALSDNREADRYVTTVAGRGYCFVAPLTRSVPIRKLETNRADPDTLPSKLQRMIGRTDVVEEVCKRLKKNRFITIVGPGGIGKTTVAVSVAHALFEEFGQALYFFDLGPLSDPQLVPNAIASALRLVLQSQEVMPSLINFLRDKRLLLVLDSCEHVIKAAAEITEQIFSGAPKVHILATSREALRVEGENVFQLAPLDCPSEGDDTVAEVLRFSAPQLFVERVVAAGHNFTPTDVEAALIGDICRRLDGIALAIELAAGCVGAFGLEQTATLLDSRFEFLQYGKRTALVRHQTLRATLDWSHDLLTEQERIVLRRLAVFVGFFTLDSAKDVAAEGEIAGESVLSIIASLVGKSLVYTDASKLAVRYRLLDTTRAYALQKLLDSNEAGNVVRRHAEYFCKFLEKLSASGAFNDVDNVAGLREHLGNVRAALEWAFISSGDATFAVALAAVAVRLFMALSLLAECTRWADRALGILTQKQRGSNVELELQAALGLSLMFTQGNSHEAGIALVRALDVAEELEDFATQLKVLGRLHIFHERIGEYLPALKFAQRGISVAAELGDPIGIAEAHSAMGISRHLEGQNARARAHLDAALVNAPTSKSINAFHFGFEFRNRAKIALARTLWLQGFPDQAIATARETVQEARAFNHPVTHCIALIWAINVLIWSGDYLGANEYINDFVANADRYSLAPYQAVGRGLRGQILIKQGEIKPGIELLQSALAAVHANRYELMTSEFNATLAEGLTAAGRGTQASTLIDEALSSVDENGDLFIKPELLRIKGNILALETPTNFQRVERIYRSSIQLAQAQAANSWELRAALSAAQFYNDSNKPDEAQDVLASAYLRFGEGFETADLKSARRMLDELVERL